MPHVDARQVLAGTAVDPLGDAVLGADQIVARSAPHRVVAGAGQQLVGTRAAGQLVVAAIASAAG